MFSCLFTFCSGAGILYFLAVMTVGKSINFNLYMDLDVGKILATPNLAAHQCAGVFIGLQNGYQEFAKWVFLYDKILT